MDPQDAVDIGREGREGEPVGALFVIGDSERVLANSRVMTFDPFRGYSEREKNICNPDIREGVKEVALMDGAFVIQHDGVILSGCRYLNHPARVGPKLKEMSSKLFTISMVIRRTTG